MTTLTDKERLLCEEMGNRYADSMASNLRDIASAMERGERAASFSATAQFVPVKRGKHVTGFTATFSPRLRVPQESTEYKLSLSNGQLSLFEGESFEDEDDGYQPDPGNARTE